MNRKIDRLRIVETLRTSGWIISMVLYLHCLYNILHQYEIILFTLFTPSTIH